MTDSLELKDRVFGHSVSNDRKSMRLWELVHYSRAIPRVNYGRPLMVFLA